MADQITGWMPTAGVKDIAARFHATGYEKGFAAGLAAAAQEGKAAMLALWFGEADIEKVIVRIRALRPPTAHDSDCALHNAPALPIGECDCSASAPAGAPCPECGCPEPWHESKCSKVGHFTMDAAPAGAPSEEDVARVAQIALQTWRNGKGWNEVVRQVYLALFQQSVKK